MSRSPSRRGSPVERRSRARRPSRAAVANISGPTVTARIPSAKSVDAVTCIPPACADRRRGRAVGRSAAAMRAARALLGARITPAAAQASASWRGETLGIGVGAADRGDDREAPAGSGRGGLGRLDGRHEAPAGSACAAEPSDDVEQDHGRRRVGRDRLDRLVAQPRIDHRVRPAHGVLVVAEVDDLVGLGLGRSELGGAGRAWPRRRAIRR